MGFSSFPILLRTTHIGQVDAHGNRVLHGEVEYLKEVLRI